MESNVSALERAFDLARSGKYKTVSDIRCRLKQEGYWDAQLSGPGLLKQLRTIIAHVEED
jgi:hypothetical protein